MLTHSADDKVAYVMAILRGLQGLNISEEEPDATDLQLIKEAMYKKKVLIRTYIIEKE